MNQLNLRALFRIDPEAEKLLDVACHTVLYQYVVEEESWIKLEVEGSTMFYTRSSGPSPSIAILNRVGEQDFVCFIEEIEGKVQKEIEQNNNLIIFTIIRNGIEMILSLWFYKEDDMERFYHLIKSSRKEIRDKKEKFVKSKKSSLKNLLHVESLEGDKDSNMKFLYSHSSSNLHSHSSSNLHSHPLSQSIHRNASFPNHSTMSTVNSFSSSSIPPFHHSSSSVDTGIDTNLNFSTFNSNSNSNFNSNSNSNPSLSSYFIPSSKKSLQTSSFPISSSTLSLSDNQNKKKIQNSHEEKRKESERGKKKLETEEMERKSERERMERIEIKEPRQEVFDFIDKEMTAASSSLGTNFHKNDLNEIKRLLKKPPSKENSSTIMPPLPIPPPSSLSLIKKARESQSQSSLQSQSQSNPQSLQQSLQASKIINVAPKKITLLKRPAQVTTCKLESEIESLKLESKETEIEKEIQDENDNMEMSKEETIKLNASSLPFPFSLNSLSSLPSVSVTSVTAVSASSPLSSSNAFIKAEKDKNDIDINSKKSKSLQSQSQFLDNSSTFYSRENSSDSIDENVKINVKDYKEEKIRKEKKSLSNPPSISPSEMVAMQDQKSPFTSKKSFVLQSAQLVHKELPSVMDLLEKIQAKQRLADESGNEDGNLTIQNEKMDEEKKKEEEMETNKNEYKKEKDKVNERIDSPPPAPVHKPIIMPSSPPPALSSPSSPLESSSNSNSTLCMTSESTEKRKEKEIESSNDNQALIMQIHAKLNEINANNQEEFINKFMRKIFSDDQLQSLLYSFKLNK